MLNVNESEACLRAGAFMEVICREYLAGVLKRCYGNIRTELRHSAEEGLPDQYDGGREYGGIGKSG